jgi:hypothetical protein
MGTERTRIESFPPLEIAYLNLCEFPLSSWPGDLAPRRVSFLFLLDPEHFHESCLRGGLQTSLPKVYQPFAQVLSECG